MQRLIAVIAGAAGGAVAIALMELLSERAAFPLILVPFATSIPRSRRRNPARSSAGTWCPRCSGCWW